MKNKIMQEEAVTVLDYKRLKISSSAFNDGGPIPSKYTADGENINPPFEIIYIPGETKCLAIIVDDPDAPSKTWAHWLAWNIHTTRHIKEGRVMEAEGRNDFGKNNYSGPHPPSGIHHYNFKVYALDALLNLPASTSNTELEKAMSEHIIGFGEMTGTYKRK